MSLAGCIYFFFILSHSVMKVPKTLFMLQYNSACNSPITHVKKSSKNVKGILVYTDRSVLLTRENVSVNIYIALHMIKRELSVPNVTLRSVYVTVRYV